jgi:uncharacterized protein YbjT (DUF2867 family)/quercetin dioxygenase-like cupin family protein
MRESTSPLWKRLKIPLMRNDSRVIANECWRMPNDRKHMTKKMKIVVIGGSGLIGKKLVHNLRQQGHEVVAASPSSGVNTLTGEGLAETLTGAQVVVDVSNSPSFSFIPKRGALCQWEPEDNAAMGFFETSGRNLLAAEAAAGVGHHIALSIVGTDRLQESGYFRAKMAQENLVKASAIPYTIVRATQFFEFVGGIAQFGTVGPTVHLSPAVVQPIAADDVATALMEVAIGAPVQGIVEIAGPERVHLDQLVARFLRKTNDPRQIITDAQARYFGLILNDRSIVPGDNPRIGPMTFDEWLSDAVPQKPVKEAASAAITSTHSAPQKIAQAVLLFLCGIAAVSVGTASADDGIDEKSKVTLVYEHVLPNVPGKSLKSVLVEYQPGGSSPAHTHPKSAFIYATVLEGAIRSKVNDGPVKVYRTGESFSENPGDHHGVSANASETEPARLLAVFVIDTGEKNLTTNDPK